MDLSVIIPTRNRAQRLRNCLASIQNQDFPRSRFEVIVVDNGSTDETREVATEFARSLQLIYSYKSEPGLHVGRHEGIRLSRASVLVFADDDIEALPTWLTAISDAFTNANVGLVGGNNYPAFEVSPPAWLNELWNKRVYRGRALGALSILDFGSGTFEIDPRYVWGCNFSIRKQVLEHTAGFHPDGMPNDRLRFRGDGETYVAESVRTLRLKTVFDSRASVYHWVPSDRMTPEYLCRRYFMQGVSDSYSQVRAAGGALDYKASLLNGLKKSRNLVRNYWRRIASRNDATRTELAKLLARAETAYWEGYRFHSNEVARDPGLLAWVLREHYQ